MKTSLLRTLTTNLDYVIFAGLAIGAFGLLNRVMRRRQMRMRPLVWLLVAVGLGFGGWFVNDAGQRERGRIASALQTIDHAEIAMNEPLNACIAAARGARIVQLAMLLILLGSAVFFKGVLHADIASRQRVEADLRRSQGRLALRAEQMGRIA